MIRDPTVLRAWGDPLGPEARGRLGTMLFLGVLCLAAFWDLGGRSLHNRGLARFGVIAHEMVASDSWLVPTRYGEVYANKPPLYPWLIALPSAVFGGVTPFLVRLPCALGLLLMALSSAAWGRLRTGSAGVGRAAALMLVGTYLLSWLGREGRPDMLAAGLATAAALVLDRLALGRGRRHDIVLAGVLIGLTLLAKGPPALVPALVVLFLPDGTNSTGQRLRNARLPLVLLVGLALPLVWLIPATLVHGQAYAKTLVFGQVAERVAGRGNHLESIGYYLVRILDAGIPWTPLYVGVLFAALWPGGRARLVGTASLLLAAAVTIGLFTLVPTKHVRYVAGAFPLLAIAVSAGLAARAHRPAGGAWARALGATRAASLVLALVVLVLGALVSGALLPALLPAVLLGALALAPRSGTAPEDARRALAGRALVAVVLLLAAFWAVRDRRYERLGDRIQREVAAARVENPPPFVVLDPVLPDQVFLTVPDPRYRKHARDVPVPVDAPRLDVLLFERDRPGVESVRGHPGRQLGSWPRRGGRETMLLLRFGDG